MILKTNKKKPGRPKSKEPKKKITLNLKITTIGKLHKMTEVTRNVSSLVDALILAHYNKNNSNQNGQK